MAVSFLLIMLIVMCLGYMMVTQASHQTRWSSSSSQSSDSLLPSYPSHHQDNHYSHFKRQRVHSSLQSMSLLAPEESVGVPPSSGTGPLGLEEMAYVNELAKLDPVTAMLELIEKVQNQHTCNQSVSLSRFDYKFPPDFKEGFITQMRAAIRTANVLNNLFRTSDALPNTLYNDAFYYSLARAVVENDDLIYGCSIAFDRDKYLTKDPTIGFCPYVYRSKPFTRTNNDNAHFNVVDIAEVTRGGYAVNGSAGYHWFWRQREQDYSSLLYNKNDVICKRLRPDDDPRKVANHSVVISTNSTGYWTVPYFDCDGGKIWQITYSVPFFGCDQSKDLHFK